MGRPGPLRTDENMLKGAAIDDGRETALAVFADRLVQVMHQRRNKAIAP
jgi:hypothetical protein